MLRHVEAGQRHRTDAISIVRFDVRSFPISYSAEETRFISRASTPSLMSEQEAHDGGAERLAFGPFQLDVRARVLLKHGEPRVIGARAFDILCALVQNDGKLVTKSALLARVWQDVSVDEGTLRFHVSALRKALGEAGPHGEYVKTLAGQGYCFVAPVTRLRGKVEIRPADRQAIVPSSAPARFLAPIGRDELVISIDEELSAKRFITLVGPGGIGKTTVASAVAERLSPRLGGAICFADLGSLQDPELAAAAVSVAVGLAVQSEDPTADLIAFLRDQSLLLVLDCCEPVIEGAAALAERLFWEAPSVLILATSREALRAEGENVVSIPPLETPPDRSDASVDEVLAFPAARLFAERAAASGWRVKLRRPEAAIVAEICRKLDGIPLAIELAAGLVNAYGLEGTADLLSDRLAVLHQGRRTALPRHQTLAATIDWSYQLLSPGERAVMRRLAIFAGPFSLEAVREVVWIEDGDVLEALVARVVAKSLLTVDGGSRRATYRVLDTTRAYGRLKLAEAGELDEAARRHAEYYSNVLCRFDFERDRAPALLAALGGHLDNVRAALDWAFSKVGNLQLGVRLAAATAPLYLELSLLTECRRWCERAIANLDEQTGRGPAEIALQGALGLAVMFSDSNSEVARIALERGLALAQELGDRPSQLRLLGRLHLFHYRTGAFRVALGFAQRSMSVAEQMADPMAIAAAHSLLGISHHLMEEPKTAYHHLGAALAMQPASQTINTLHFGVDYRNRAGICMARTLWVLGYPERARTLARRTVEEAEDLGNPLTLCIALIWAVSVSLWIGDWAEAEADIERLVAHARSRSIIPYPAAGIGVKGYLAIMRGDARAGVLLVRSALVSLRESRYELLTTALNSALAEGLLALGERDQALDTIQTAWEAVERNGDRFNVPELLRIKGDILASGPAPRAQEAQACYLQAQQEAIRSSALSFELRSGISLARLWLAQGRGPQAAEMLAAVCARFEEGFDTPDFLAAQRLIAQG
ncbi:winged helix-turn-helix domain-containing protein [Alsobacter sp. KACC 23698]|uniref:Winged helix-turn-helix domain-containing protein n=1 Tax=Alsobacter sp. KACC 23698 TaxID=3149229 RepID=A0AAU7JKL1_9HYPH